MTIAFSCVLIMIVFPYIFTILAKSGLGFNNEDPRNYLEKTQGWRQRANYIQLNSFETTPAFGLAVIIAQFVHAPQLTINQFALVFVGTRILYAICYLANYPTLRSLCWLANMVCIFSLFYISY